MMNRVRLLCGLGLLWAIVGMGVAVAAQPAEERCFAETGFCITGRFLSYWEQNGGLPVFGYPLTTAAEAVNAETGKAYLTQWFERARLELHPDQPAPYDVLLGRLGSDMLQDRSVDWVALLPAAGPQQGCLWFEQTRHTICDQPSGPSFLSYWQRYGLRDPQLDRFAQSLALFGLPLSEVTEEINRSDGKPYLTQWFERARFEWHPEQPDEYRVLLGLLGTERIAPGPVIYASVPDTFIPSGWMGDIQSIQFDPASATAAHAGPTSIRISYTPMRSGGQGWAGIYWQYPENNWGTNPAGRNLTGATKLTFWARGELGGERAEFKAGGIKGQYSDSLKEVSTGIVILSSHWRQYTIDLRGTSLSHVIGGFVWVTNRDQNPQGATIYLDDILYE